MLILSRKSNEKIYLADLGVTIEVLRISGSRVSLGIQAPKSIRIVRDELEVARDEVGLSPDNNAQSEKSIAMPYCGR